MLGDADAFIKKMNASGATNVSVPSGGKFVLNNEGVMAPPPPPPPSPPNPPRPAKNTNCTWASLQSLKTSGNLPVNAELGPEAGQCEDTELDPNGIQNGTSCNLKCTVPNPPWGAPTVKCGEGVPEPSGVCHSAFPASLDGISCLWLLPKLYVVAHAVRHGLGRDDDDYVLAPTWNTMTRAILPVQRSIELDGIKVQRHGTLRHEDPCFKGYQVLFQVSGRRKLLFEYDAPSPYGRTVVPVVPSTTTTIVTGPVAFNDDGGGGGGSFSILRRQHRFENRSTFGSWGQRKTSLLFWAVDPRPTLSTTAPPRRCSRLEEQDYAA